MRPQAEASKGHERLGKAKSGQEMPGEVRNWPGRGKEQARERPGDFVLFWCSCQIP